MKLSVLKKISDASKIAFKIAPGKSIHLSMILYYHHYLQYKKLPSSIVSGDKENMRASIEELKSKIESKKQAIEQKIKNFLQNPLAGVSQDILSISR